MSVLKLYICNSGRLRAFIETGTVSLELMNALRLVGKILVLLIVVGIKLVVSVTRELEEASVAAGLLISFVMRV